MPTLHDDEFGDIMIRRIKRARSIQLHLRAGGKLEATMPPLTPLFLVKRLVASSRTSIRELRASHPQIIYQDGMQIGKSHWLKIDHSGTFSHKLRGQAIHITIPSSIEPTDPLAQSEIQTGIIAALRKEAKSYLPRRLQYLADEHGFHYQKVRFSHARSRWGSCSSNGTISLNIALMRLDFDVIDYVLIHELSHTREMNHSHAFWKLVESCDPAYKLHRTALRKENPMIL